MTSHRTQLDNLRRKVENGEYRRYELDRDSEYWCDLILLVNPSHKTRMEGIFQLLLASSSLSSSPSVKLLETLKEHRLILIRAEQPYEVVRLLHSFPLLYRHIHKVFHVTHTAHTLTDIGQAIAAAAAVDQHGFKLRLVTYPSHMAGELAATIPENVQLVPKNVSHIIYVVFAFRRYYYCIQQQQHQPPPVNDDDSGGDNGVVCDAQYKLRELLDLGQHFRRHHYSSTALSLSIGALLNTIVLTAAPNTKALDIGAAPGGWSSLLSSYGCHVLAVDGGELEVTADTITHVQKRIEDAISDGDVERFGPLYDVCVCDMNQHPHRAAKMMMKIASFLRPGAVIILTVKAFASNRESDLLCDQAMHMLSSSAYTSLASVHLCSNTRKERTIVGVCCEYAERKPFDVDANIQQYTEDIKAQRRTKNNFYELKKQRLLAARDEEKRHN